MSIVIYYDLKIYLFNRNLLECVRRDRKMYEYETEQISSAHNIRQKYNMLIAYIAVIEVA